MKYALSENKQNNKDYLIEQRKNIFKQRKLFDNDYVLIIIKLNRLIYIYIENMTIKIPKVTIILKIKLNIYFHLLINHLMQE